MVLKRKEQNPDYQEDIKFPENNYPLTSYRMDIMYIGDDPQKNIKS